MKERDLRPAEVADIFGVHSNTIRRWADQGMIPSYELPSGHRRFPVNGILRAKERMIPALNLQNPYDVDRFRAVVERKVTAEEAGPAFSYSGHMPIVKVDHESFDFLQGQA